MNIKRSLGMAVLATAAMAGAHAGEVYGGIGLPGLMIGYAQPLNERFTLRADVATLGSRSYSTTRDGVAYSGSVKVQRAGAFVDWFVMSGSFRLTGGLTFNTMRAELSGAGNGKVIQLGNLNTSYTLGANDRFDVKIAFPNATPYLGLGGGHHAGKGWGFVWDIGASVGKPKVSASGSGTILGAAAAQTHISEEVSKLQKDFDKIPLVPQLSLAVNYRF